MITAPAAFRRWTTTASSVGLRPASIGVPFSVGKSLGVDDVLDADGQAVQRPDGAAGGAIGVAGLGLGSREVGIEMDEGADIGLAFGDPLEQGLAIVECGKLAAHHPVAGVEGVEVGEVVSHYRPYTRSGSQNTTWGKMYMIAMATKTMPRKGKQPQKICVSRTCGGAIPLR